MAGENLRLNVLLTADGRILSAAVNKARQETKGFGDETERTGRKARVAAQAQRRHAAAVSAATLAIRRQGAALGFAAGAATQYLGAFAGIAALFGSVRKFFSLTDDYMRVSNSVKLATNSTQEFIETQKELFAMWPTAPGRRWWKWQDLYPTPVHFAKGIGRVRRGIA